jgi:hypothetical protein
MITDFTRMLTGDGAFVALSMGNAIHNALQHDQGEGIARLVGVRYEQDEDNPTGLDDLIYLDFDIDPDYDNAERNGYEDDFAIFIGAEFNGWVIVFSDSCPNCKQYHLALQQVPVF